MHRQSRADRFRELRYEILKHPCAMSLSEDCCVWWRCGPFAFMLTPTRHADDDVRWNLDIWIGVKFLDGNFTNGRRVAEVEWDQQDRVKLHRYRAGPWEAQILAILKGNEKVVPFERRWGW